MKRRGKYSLDLLLKSMTLMLILWMDVSASLCAQNRIDVTKHGVVSDGEVVNTKAIQQLIDKESKKGGTTLVFPQGSYLTGSLVMKSNVNIYLEKGAVLLGSTNPMDYEKIEMPGRPESPKKDDNSQMALLVAHKANHFTISGKGTIDGQGRKLALNIDSLHHAGVLIDPKYNYRRHRPNETARPKLVRFSQCNNVRLEGLTMKNSACWGLSFELCKKLVLENLKIENRAYWNNDGMDISDCNNVVVNNCDVNSADDGICLKSYYPGYCNDTIRITNCTIRSSASAIKFGTASFGGFKNVTIDNIKVYDTFRSAIAIESVDGAIIENIEASNIEAKNTGNAIFIRLGHRGGEKPGAIKNVYLHNIQVEIPFGRPDINYDMRGPAVGFFHNPIPSSITGIPGFQVENVKLENIEVTCPGRASKGMAYVPVSRLDQVPNNIKGYPEFTMFGELPSWGMYVRHVNGIEMNNVKFSLTDTDYRPAFVFDQVEKLTIDKLTLPTTTGKSIILKETTKTKINETIEDWCKQL
ncbi:glycoside hydrolase family 28 protein [Prolixibacteraceae bacterium JC049]|nr:glycoside hydrolase family 28 protein [Prolixibacteraceae bacterium JC049]